MLNTNINQRILDQALRQIPFNHDEFGDLSGLDATGLAALAVAADAELLMAWYARLMAKGDATRLEAYISLLVDRDEVADNIDARLARGDFQVLNDLVRLGLPWEHPNMVNALGNDDTRHAAAIALVEQDTPEPVMAWMEEEVDPEIFRAFSLLGAPFVEQLLAVREETDDESEERAILDASLLGMVEPEGYGRLLMNGDIESDWTAYPRLMGDVFALCGPNSWVETLALLEAAGDLDAFSFAGLIGAAVSSLTLGLEEDDEVSAPESLEEFQTDMRFAVAAGLAPDEEILDLLYHAVAHECWLTAEEPTPGVPGLPLSSSNPTEEDVAEVATQLGEYLEDGADDPVKRVAVVRNLLDATLWGLDEPDFVAPLKAEAAKLLKSKGPAAPRAAAYLFLNTVGANPELPDFKPGLKALVAEGDIAGLEQLARGEGVAALSAIQQLLDLRSTEGLQAVLNAWMDAPVLRSDSIRRLILDGLIDVVSAAHK